MSVFRGAVVTATVMGMAAGVMPMQSTAAPPQALRVTQNLVKPLKVKKQTRAGKWTKVLAGPMRTNAGQPVTVVAVGRDAKGHRVSVDRMRGLAQPKGYFVWAKPGTKVVLKLSAPATPRYTAFSKRYVVRTKGPMAQVQSNGFAVGPQAAGSAWGDFFAPPKPYDD